jgi:hypothetical protein
MNALKTVMDVHRHALIMLGATLVHASPAIAWQVIVADVQKLMNVLKEQMVALRIVQTLLGAIPAPVTPVIV